MTHTFAPGIHEVTLVTTDDEGAKGFGFADEISVVIGPMLPGGPGGLLPSAPTVS